MAALRDVSINKSFPDYPKGFSFENYRRNISIQNQKVNNFQFLFMFLEICQCPSQNEKDWYNYMWSYF